MKYFKKIFLTIFTNTHFRKEFIGICERRQGTTENLTRPIAI